jgi:hypothetical protein
MNDEGALARRPRPDLSRRSDSSTGAGRLTQLQDWLITAHLMLEDARDDLNAEQWRAFVWIVCDLVGKEAALLAVGEALEALEDAA